MKPRLLLGVALILGAAWPAHAQPEDARTALQEARRAFDQARLDASLRAYDRAVRAGLPRRTLVTLLGERAVVAHALGDQAGVERDLRALLSLDRAGELADEAPPSLRRRLDALRPQATALRVDVVATPTTEGWTVRVLVRGDDASLVQDTRVEIEHPDGSTETLSTSRRQVQVPEYSDRLRVRAVALGHGGHRLVRSEVRDVERPGGDRRDRDPLEEDATPRDPRRVKMGVGIAVGLAIVLAVGIGLSVRTPESGIRPTAPREVR